LRIRFSVAVATLLFVAAIAVGGPAMAATRSVSAVDYNFVPKSLTIAVGDTVVWTNNGMAQHTVTSDGGAFNSGTLNPGATYSHTFGAAGSFPYHCTFHGGAGGVGMSGTIFVQSGPPPSGTPNPTGTGVPLPNTGAGPFTGPFVWFGLAFLIAGSGVLLSLRRRRA
jgi:LPXTG-motif cell wall-anchored protein